MGTRLSELTTIYSYRAREGFEVVVQDKLAKSLQCLCFTGFRGNFWSLK